MINGWKGIGPFKGGPLKRVHHKTQGSSYKGARSAYVKNRSEPHFTVDEQYVYQHVDTAYGSRSLRNASGGVQTNFDGAIQIEVVGHSGVSMPEATMANLVRLLRWIGEEHDVPWHWPMGRPPQTSEDGYGLNNGDRDASTWDHVGGDYGHSQVPENTHWDPAYTDLEWWVLNERMGAISQPPPKESLIVVNRPPVALMTHAAWGSGYTVVTDDGGIFNFGGSPFYGSLGGVALNKPIIGAEPTPSGAGYILHAADGGVFCFGDAEFHGSVQYSG